MGHLITPYQSLAIELFQGREWPGCKERIPHIAYRSLDASFLISSCRRDRTRLTVIVGGEFEQARMKANLIAVALQHGASKIVVEHDSGHPSPVGKRIDMTAEKVLQSLIEEELQKQGARVRQRQYETGQPAAGLTHPDFPKCAQSAWAS